MKTRILSIAVLVASAMGANAQEKAISYSKFFDNWQLGVKGGGFSDTHREAFLKNTRATFGLELEKQISPAFRLGVEGMAYVRPVAFDENPTYNNFIDQTNVSLVGTINLSNLILGYKGAPRFFEVEGFAGLGWRHTYLQNIVPGVNTRENAVTNGMTAQFGSNLLFNLGESKKWAVKLSPAIIYGVDTPAKNSANSLNSVNSITQLTAGVVYRFKGSNGARHITLANTVAPAPDTTELDRLRASLKEKESELTDNQKKIKKLEEELEAERNKKPQVIEKTVTKSKKTLESVVTYRVGKTTIESSQLPNVERIATYLKKYPNSKVVIKGFASPEGNLEKNQKLAADRAESVKKILVTRYKISSDRIQAEGNGIGDMFSEPDWNRVSISTIVE
ncbi:OmpA family protein [uncultured Capnocytophaga sp.]|jgi:putative immunoreactive 43 kDa antigen PG32|uniref:OmpA family protein n=1 Tax=uncultured Capnocytophaga sp. TaxID=159273 RepID=UPI002624C1BF|nr:OmpA family protein [uncultured Capnocytophaga sp.]